MLDNSIKIVSDGMSSLIISDLSSILNNSIIDFGCIYHSGANISTINVKITNFVTASNNVSNYEMHYNFPVFFSGGYVLEFNTISIRKTNSSRSVTLELEEI